jgi:uncharacterized RDD family membrane protein YckC
VWYYLDANHEVNGPVETGPLVDMLRASATGLKTLVWREGMAGWEPAGTRTEILTAGGLPPPPPPPPAPPRPSVPSVARDATVPSVARDTTVPSVARDASLAIPTADLRLPAALPDDAEFNSVVDDPQTHPWRRLFARYVDILLMAMFAGVMIGVIGLNRTLSGVDTLLKNDIVFGMICLLLLVPLEAILLATFGGTLGKALYGVDLQSEDGKPLSFGQSFSRAIKVYFRGMAIGFPLISLVAAYFGYKSLKENGRTSWDIEEKIIVRHRPMGVVRIIIITLVWAALIGIMAFGATLK